MRIMEEFLYKINMISGKSYVVKSTQSNVVDFLDDLFNKGQVVTYYLAELKQDSDSFYNNNVAIVVKNIESVTYKSE